jgi:hypothetical protein
MHRGLEPLQLMPMTGVPRRSKKPGQAGFLSSAFDEKNETHSSLTSFRYSADLLHSRKADRGGCTQANYIRFERWRF